MWYYVTKLVVSALLIVLISEIAKRYTWIGGFLASLPIVSYLAMIWLYVDTRDTQKIASLATSIFWLVLPSLSMFIALPLLLKRLPFVPSLAAATVVMFVCYAITALALRRFGVAI